MLLSIKTFIVNGSGGRFEMVENITDPGLAAVNSMPIRPETILITVGICLFVILAISLALWIWAKFNR
jgi:hypothetical protein